MPTNPTSESINTDEFNLKHRVTGAAVLLFLGAAVLPWLLGPPSQASKVSPQVELETVSDFPIEVQEADLLVDGGIDIEETVYISKITPIDATKKTSLSAVVQKVDVVPVKSISNKKDIPKADEVAKKDDQVNEKAANDAKQKRVLAAKEKLKKDQATTKAAAEKQKKDAAESALQAKLAKEKALQASNVDVGWIVQVGLFTEKDRAIAFISDLKNKGFKASSNVVDTNRGKNTGTRVWLGPFARKGSAANEVKRLKSKAGKDGFIRVYP